MISMSRSSMLLAFTVAIITAAFLFTAPVCAQDEILPESPPAEDPITEELPTVEEPIAEELPSALEDAADTGVVLVDESGDPLPLAVEGTAEALAGGDPYYKVGTITYYFRFLGECGTTPNCFESDFPISEAIDHISTTGLPSDGMIYVEAGTYAESAYIDPLLLDPIQSGLKGLIGTVVDGIPQVNLTGSISIYDVDYGFTIKGFNCSESIFISGISGNLKIEDVKVSDDTVWGILITNHNGAVILNRVEANGSAKGGAYINNTAGTAGVTITNSSFNHNGSDNINYVGGLTIATKGTVSLDGVTGIGNTGGQPGLFIQQSGTISVKNSIFSNNSGYGLTNSWDVSTIPPTAHITLLNVIADENQRGLGLGTKGNITLTGVSARKNTIYGADLDTCYQDITACRWLGSGVITIKNSTFDGNGSQRGLNVSARGAITLTNVSASNNTDAGFTPYGATLSNQYSQLIAPVKITMGNFNNNDNVGLLIVSKGLVTLSQVSASGNQFMNGVYIDNTSGTTAGVTISGTALAYNHFNDNIGFGIEIVSKGSITLKYTQSNNATQGARLVNTLGTGGVTISNSTFNHNIDTNLYVRTNGAITATSIQASNSTNGMGADLDNHTSLSTPGVTIKGTTTAYNLFNGNYLNGFKILTKGAVTLSYAKVDDNDDYGAEIINTGGTGGVTISNATFNNNTYTNLYVRTNGAIKISNIQANSSGYFGADLVNSSSLKPQGVTISNATFWDNAGTGIYVASKGNIILTNTASWDNLSGALLNNSWGTGYVKITNPKSTDTSIQHGFDNNGDGLWINTYGTASLTNVNAIGNYYYGIYIFGTYQKGATLTNCRVEGNAAAVDAIAGIRISSMGPVTISGGYSNSNSKVGLQIDNTFALDTAPKPVTILNFSANSNVDRGIYVLSRGAISLTSVTANDTSGASQAAIDLDNTAQTANVTLSKVKANGNVDDGIRIISKGAVKVSSSVSSDNGWYGSYINTQGTITLTNMIANENDYKGAYLSNQSSLVYAAVTVTGSTNGNSFSGNADNGIDITSRGAVTLNNITADDNDFEGILLDNYSMGAGLGNVTVNNVYTRYDGMAGFSISSAGNISLKGVVSMLNFGHGSILYTHNHNLTISSSIFSGNYSTGIYAQVGSNGIFTMSTTMYFGNDTENNDNPNLLIVH